MKKAAVSILIFLFLGNVSLFSQDGEEIDFLEKVSEPKKKTVGKKTSNSVSSNASKVSKKRKRKSSKKEGLKISYRSDSSRKFEKNNRDRQNKRSNRSFIRKQQRIQFFFQYTNQRVRQRRRTVYRKRFQNRSGGTVQTVLGQRRDEGSSEQSARLYRLCRIRKAGAGNFL